MDNEIKAIIKVTNLSAWYQEYHVLDNIDFEVYPGEIFIIAGGSGSGKTTLLRCLIGLHNEASGKIMIDGDDLITASENTRIKILQKIGVAFQSTALFGSMTLIENVMFPLEELTSLPSDANMAIATTKLEMVGLGDFLNYYPAELSGGMQKRAAIARAMILEPKIIFLDEPSSGLDPVTSIQIDNLIKTLSQALKITFVIVSHDLPSIYNIGQRLIMLHDKKIIATGIPGELQKSSTNTLVNNFFNRQV